MECYSALQRKEILSHTEIGVDLDDIMPSEISQPQKTLHGPTYMGDLK